MSKARGLADLGNVYSDGALSNRNLIINGPMTVSQRGTSASPAPIGYLIDRFATYSSGVGVLSIAQSSDAPAGFTNSALITVTTAGTPSGGSYRTFQQAIEGNISAVLAQGTPEAKAFTVSFWVKTSILGTFSGSMRDSIVSRSYVFEYTMNAINTWEYKTVTIAGSTGGTFNTGNTGGLTLAFSQGQGTSFATATVGSWVTGNFHGSTTETDLIATLGATWQITGVQLEAGDTATPFEHRSFGQELALCQRYFQELCGRGTIKAIANVSYYTTTDTFCAVRLQSEMRVTPTAIIPNQTDFKVFANEGNSPTTAVLLNASSGTASVELTFRTAARTVGFNGWVRTNSAAASIQLDAEL